MDITKMDEKYMDLSQTIESGLKQEYDKNSSLTNTYCIYGLDNAKLAIKKEFGYAKNQKVTNMPKVQGIINWCIEVGLARIDKINDLTLKEYVDVLETIKRSVKRHSHDGDRGYYEFIRDFVQ